MDKRQPHHWPPAQSPTSSAAAPPNHHIPVPPRSDYPSTLPPILPAKRQYDDDPWANQHPPSSAPLPPPSNQPPPTHQTQTAQQHQQQHQLPQHTSPQQHVRILPVRSVPQSSGQQRSPTDLYPVQQHLDSPNTARRITYTQQTSDSPGRFQKDPFDDIKLPYNARRPNPTSPAAVVAAAAAAAAAAQHVHNHQQAAGTHPSHSVHGPHAPPPPVTAGPTPTGNSTPMDAFILAAEMGARAQSAVDTASGDGVFETYELGKTIVASSKLYANQRRSNRLLPGGSDSTTAACYMIGGTPDSILSPLVSRVNPCDPREERCKAVERVLKDKTRGAICALNGENPREARADNLAAVRICEVVADILVAYSSRRMMESRKELYATVAKQEGLIKELREELERERRKRAELENECWGQTDGNRAVIPSTEVHQFERDKGVIRRSELSGTGRGVDVDRGSLTDSGVDVGGKQDGQ